MKLDTQRLILREVEATDVDVVFAWQVDLRYLEHYPAERTSRQDTSTSWAASSAGSWNGHAGAGSWLSHCPSYGFSERRRDVMQVMELVIDTAQRITSGMD